MRNGFLIRNTVWNCNYDNNGIDKIQIQMVSISSSFSPQQTCYTVTWRYLWYSCFFSLRHMSSCITIRYTILSVILLIFLRCTVEKYCRIGTFFLSISEFWKFRIKTIQDNALAYQTVSIIIIFSIFPPFSKLIVNKIFRYYLSQIWFYSSLMCKWLYLSHTIKRNYEKNHLAQ